MKQIVLKEHYQHYLESQLVGDKPVGSFTSIAEDLNSGLPRNKSSLWLWQDLNSGLLAH